jgi:hypothetical protein
MRKQKEVCREMMNEIRKKVPLHTWQDNAGAWKATVALVRERIKVLAAQQKMIDLGLQIVNEFNNVFQSIVLPVDRLPEDVCTLQDNTKGRIEAGNHSLIQHAS